MLGAQHEHLRLYAKSLQLLHAGLRGLGLQLAGCRQIGHECEVDAECALRPQLPSELPYGLEEGLALNVAYRSANLGDAE